MCKLETHIDNIGFKTRMSNHIQNLGQVFQAVRFLDLFTNVTSKMVISLNHLK